MGFRVTKSSLKQPKPARQILGARQELDLSHDVLGRRDLRCAGTQEKKALHLHPMHCSIKTPALDPHDEAYIFRPSALRCQTLTAYRRSPMCTQTSSGTLPFRVLWLGMFIFDADPAEAVRVCYHDPTSDPLFPPSPRCIRSCLRAYFASRLEV